MENDLATLQISKAEDDEILIVAALTTPNPLYDLCLVGCFVMASMVHFATMRTTLANLWHALRVVQITDLGDKRFLFRFFHRVVIGALWTFNNHLLLVNFVGTFEEYDAKQVSSDTLSYMRMRVRLDIWAPLKEEETSTSPGNSVFCPIRLTRDITDSDMGWDASLWEVGWRATVVESVWLWKEAVGSLVDGVSSGNAFEGQGGALAVVGMLL
ncbi:hypothetical protein Golob_012018, partial [Gossypium lobatum]|nr:hypothetical protein [Gossypium lobatum]